MLSSETLLPPAARWVLLALLATVGVPPVLAEVTEKSRTTIDQIIGARGMYKAGDDVYRVVLPQPSATVVLDYQTLSPNLGLNSWAAFSPAAHHEALLTGQLLLLTDEVDSVLTSVLTNGLRVTGLADATVFEGPRLKSMDVMGNGSYQELATAFRKAIDAQRQARRVAGGHIKEVMSPILSLDSSIESAPLNAILSMRGSISEGVYHATIGRRTTLGGDSIGPEMGVATWMSVVGTNQRAIAHGEFASDTAELQPLLKALRAKDISVLSIRNHMDGERPQIFFVHFRQQGKANELAKNLRYVLNVQAGTTQPPALAQALPREEQ